MLNITKIIKNMTESETYVWINNVITKMFQDVEKCESETDGLTASENKRKLFSRHISQLKDLALGYAVNLKPEQFIELNVLIEGIKAIEEMTPPSRSMPKDKYYESLLGDFKEIGWLDIQIEKLNWVENNK